jgi:hypothetical protein
MEKFDSCLELKICGERGCVSRVTCCLKFVRKTRDLLLGEFVLQL